MPTCPTVLVVDDDEGVLEYATEILERVGYRVLAFSSGPGALPALSGRPGAVELVLTDLFMPGMSGLELAREVARTAPGTPVLLMSGTPERELPGLAGLPFLRKPFSPEELLGKISGLGVRPGA